MYSHKSTEVIFLQQTESFYLNSDVQIQSPKSTITKDIFTRVHSFNIHKHFINKVMLIFNNVAWVGENEHPPYLQMIIYE